MNAEDDLSAPDGLQLIADEAGLAVLGPHAEVERFLASEGLESRSFDLDRLGGGVARVGGAAAQVGAELAANSGRWVKLSKESAEAMKKYGLRESSRSGLATGVIKGSKGGQVGGFVEFVKGPGAGAGLSNPAVLAGAGGVLSQLAMQQAMHEITDYLRRIDAKLDDVLHAQKDSVLAKLIGAGFVVDEAMTVRNARGKVDEVTWSKVQTAPSTIAEVQGYALGQLDALAQKMESARKVGTVAEVMQEAQSSTQEWLAVLARTFQLQDGIAVLELDRVLDAAPSELDAHRIGLRTARDDRLALIEASTQRLLSRIIDAVSIANDKVLLHPSASPATVVAGGQVHRGIVEFHELLGMSDDRTELTVRRWASAAGEVRDKALESGVETVVAARRHGGAVADSAGRAARDLQVRVSGRVRRLRSGRGREAGG